MKPDPPEKQETVAKDESGGEAPGVLIQDVGISPQDLQEAEPQELQEAGWEAGWDKYGVWWQPDEAIPGLWWHWTQESSWGRWKDQYAPLK